MRRTRNHACRFATADIAAAEPGQILQCPICLRPGRVESTNPAWIVEMTWRERRHWRKTTSAA